MSDPRRTTATYPVRSNSNTIEWVYDRTQYSSNEGLITEVAMNAMPAVTRPCGSRIRPRHGVAPRPARHPRRASSQGALSQGVLSQGALSQGVLSQGVLSQGVLRRGVLRRAGAPDVALRL